MPYRKYIIKESADISSGHTGTAVACMMHAGGMTMHDAQGHGCMADGWE